MLCGELRPASFGQGHDWRIPRLNGFDESLNRLRGERNRLGARRNFSLAAPFLTPTPGE
jgi:hypothetical protein